MGVLSGIELVSASSPEEEGDREEARTSTRYTTPTLRGSEILAIWADTKAARKATTAHVQDGSRILSTDADSPGTGSFIRGGDLLWFVCQMYYHHPESRFII